MKKILRCKLINEGEEIPEGDFVVANPFFDIRKWKGHITYFYIEEVD